MLKYQQGGTFSLFQNIVRGILPLLFILMLAQSVSSAQSNLQTLWKNTNETLLKSNNGARYIYPTIYRTISSNLDDIRNVVKNAPMEETGKAFTSKTIITVPFPDGSNREFYVTESPIMAPELAAKYPELRTYTIEAVDAVSGNGRIDCTPLGFHGMIFTPEGTVFVDPYRMNDNVNYISYYKRDFVPYNKGIHQGNCVVDNPAVHTELDYLLKDNNSSLGTGAKLRTYRLALAADYEYVKFYGGTIAGALNGMVVTMNRVNGVYIRELAIKMVMVANDTLLIYPTSSASPYTDSDGSAMLDQNQTACDKKIGSANYDIGHVFSTGGGGIAQLGCVCQSGSKAQGVTGSPSPVGDAYDIDYVAHEMGHEFGANHPFNSTTGNCGGGNRNASTAYEIGSGTTIMAYAGICDTDDLQPHSDAYFHAISLDEIYAYTNSGSGSSCPVTVATNNGAPTVTVPAGGFTIPKSTPFSLTGSATDPDNDTLTYCWEEFDLGSATTAAAPSGNAPAFRSFNPVATPTRVFPKISDILGNTSTIGEVLPSYARNLTFRLTARDNKVTGGATAYNKLTFAVSNAAGPFTVTYPSTAVVFPRNSSQTITWNVASTNVTPVSCANVNILLSTDGGLTFPTVLASKTPNDGSETITIPNSVSTSARIKVEAADNIFFAVSKVNFSIKDTTFIALNSPKGGEQWLINSNHSITWNSANVTNVKIESSFDNGATWNTIVASTPAGVGTYAWVAPATEALQTKIRISDVNAVAASATSDVFSIVTVIVSKIAITSPVGGESWQAKSTHNITWTSSYITTALIELSTDSGISWSTVTASTPASTGSYSWVVANTPSANCKIRLSDSSNSSVKSVSTAAFTITAAPLSQTILTEDFAKVTSGSVGAPMNADISATLDTYTSVAGWTGTKVYQAGGAIKLGSSSIAGYIVTPSLDFSSTSGAGTIKFDVQTYNTDAKAIQVSISTDGGTTFTQVGSDIPTTSAMVSQTVAVTGGNNATKIKIAGKDPGTNRFYLDNISIATGSLSEIRGSGYSSKLPLGFELSQNYPNPFNPATTIGFTVPQQTNVQLRIFNQLGQEVATLVNGEVGAGYHSVTWNAANQSSGIYFYELRNGNTVSVKKLILMK